MFSFFSLFTWNKRQLQILTLVSKTQHENGRYVLNFDVVKNSEYGRIKEIRGKDSQVYEELKCIAAPCSGDIEMELKDKKCQFTFTVYGALEPASKLEKGENVLEYNDSMFESRRLLTLIPTFDEASGGRATIKFWVDENVKHTVTICDVPVEKTKKMSSSTLSRQSSDGSSLGSSQTFTKSVDEKDTTVHAGSVRTLDNATVTTSGPAMSPAENQALPVLSRSTEAYDKILTDASLQCLASGLSPQDSQKLLIQLQVPFSVIEQKKKDHPGDIVSAMFHCFLYWRGEKGKPDTNKHLYDVLIAQLEAISRRDIKSTIMEALSASNELKKDDFKHQ